MVDKFPCGICQKVVGKKHSAVCWLCNACDEWTHIAYNNLDEKLKNKRFLLLVRQIKNM